MLSLQYFKWTRCNHNGTWSPGCAYLFKSYIHFFLTALRETEGKNFFLLQLYFLMPVGRLWQYLFTLKCWLTSIRKQYNKESATPLFSHGKLPVQWDFCFKKSSEKAALLLKLFLSSRISFLNLCSFKTFRNGT